MTNSQTQVLIALERDIEKVIDSATISDDTDSAVVFECARRYIEREVAARERRRARTPERTALLREASRVKLRARMAAYAEEIAAVVVADHVAERLIGETPLVRPVPGRSNLPLVSNSEGAS